MNNDYKYKIAVCPFCMQGWVEIVKEFDTNTLYLCCSECEIEWDSPEDVLNKTKGTRFKYGKVTEPTYEEIMMKRWANYVIKQ